MHHTDEKPATGPLAGVRVIDVTSIVLGPYATQMLGDLGADVIKVESPRGDDTRWIGPSRTAGMGSYFANLNRNKRSVVLDLKQPAAKDALLRLVDGADVFVHNMRQSAAKRLGLDYPTLAARNQRLVYASASGFRQGSTQEDTPAFDDLIQGISGLASLNAGPDGAPRYAPTVLVDKLTGHMLGSMIGMALFHRERTGQGQEVHVPMLETTLSFLMIEHLWWGTLGEIERGVGYPRMLTPHRRPYPTQDGFISVIASSDAQYARLLTALGRPELIDDPRFTSIAARAANVDAVLAVLTEGLRARSTAEWLTLLGDADIPCGNANSLADLFEDPYLHETGFFQTVQHPVEGRVTVPSIAATFSASPPAVRRLWPTLGEHTSEVLREAGFAEAEIATIVPPEA
jgi:crotonobetainyl-CoA:carnitine CoA-transferase CaiB-like acyl-CoA transferase